MVEVMTRHAPTTFEDQEQELVMELTKLQRQYRIMENDRRAYRVDTMNVIKKQTKQIEELQKERNELQMHLQMARSDQYISKDMENFLHLQALLKQMDIYKEEMVKEREMIRMLDEEYNEVQKDLDEEWKKLGGKQAGEDYKLHLVKKIRRLENNLDKGMKEFNKIIAENTRQKDLISHMFQVRHHFSGLYEKLLKHLEQTKNEMNETITQASQAFDQREECQMKIQALKDRWEKDDTQYQLEMKELERSLEHDNVLKTFMYKKTRDRDLIMDITPKKPDSEKKTRSKDKENNIDFYRKAFEKIADLTGEKSIHMLVENIRTTEESNFALFNYVSDLNGEIEQLTEEIQHLNKQIEEVKIHEEEREAKRQQEIKTLEIKLEKQTAKLDDTTEKLTRAKKSYDLLEKGIELLFEKTNAKQVLPPELLEENEINTKNVMIYLGAIEQRATQLIAIFKYIKAKIERDTHSPRGHRTALPALPGSQLMQPQVMYEIQAPSITNEELIHLGDDEIDNQPLDPAQLKTLIQKEKISRAVKAPAPLKPTVGGKQREQQQIKKKSRF